MDEDYFNENNYQKITLNAEFTFTPINKHNKLEQIKSIQRRNSNFLKKNVNLGIVDKAQINKFNSIERTYIKERKDNYGTTIQKGAKFHKTSFSDKNLVEIIQIDKSNLNSKQKSNQFKDIVYISQSNKRLKEIFSPEIVSNPLKNSNIQTEGDIKNYLVIPRKEKLECNCHCQII